MQLRLLNKTEHALEIEIEGENETLLNLLKQKLLEDEKVVAATFVIGHPLLDKPRFFVEVSSGKPEQNVKNAAKELRALFDEFETQLVKAAGTA